MKGITTRESPRFSEAELAKLPKWAAQRARAIENHLAAAEERLSFTVETSNVIADPYSTSPVGLGVDTVIEFQLPLREGRTFPDSFRVRLEGDELDVMSTGMSFCVLPRASNRIAVRMVER